MSAALIAAFRVAWWSSVLFVAPLDRIALGREWPNYIDARWLLFLARADLKNALEGK